MSMLQVRLGMYCYYMAAMIPLDCKLYPSMNFQGLAQGNPCLVVSLADWVLCSSSSCGMSTAYMNDPSINILARGKAMEAVIWDRVRILNEILERPKNRLQSLCLYWDRHIEVVLCPKRVDSWAGYRPFPMAYELLLDSAELLLYLQP